MVDAKDIRDAFSRKADYFLKNVETLSMKGARRELEAEMGLPERALDQHRDVVEALVDKMLNGSKVEAGAKAKRRKPTAADAGKKPAKKQRAAGSGAAGKGQGEERGEGAKGTAADTQLEKLRRICKAATIGISPTLYRLSVEEQRTRLAQLLAAEGLSISSDRAEVDRVKRQRERARDLEGIDTSNIITSSSRRRTVRSAPRYAELDTPAAGEDDASGDEEENDDDDGGDALARIEDDVSSSGEEAQEAGQVDEDGESDEPEDAGGSSGSSSGADVGKEQPAGKRRDCSDSAVPKDDVERGRRNPLLHASDED